MGDRCSGTNQLLKDFYIPKYILLPGLSVEHLSYTPSCPVIVFINTKSGGQLGGDLIVTYRELLNRVQVFDLSEEAPDKVLHNIYHNLEKLKSEGDNLAAEIQRRLRLIVAGGDGTASWLLGVVCDLQLAYPPPIATVPLGTGNNLPFSFGWGKKNPGIDRQSVKSFLKQVMEAREMKIDSWHIIMRMRSPKDGSCDPIAPLELPHSLHVFHHVSETDSLKMEGYQTYRGGFWNYFSIGMDAEVSYAFHSKRKLHPEKFKNQLVNQRTYVKLGCTQGWFCASLFHPTSRNIARLAKVKIMKKDGKWEELHIPHSIRSIVCLNLPSFSGGLNPWGTPSTKKQRDRDLTSPYVDDGLLEIVGFKNAWHGLVLLSPKGHGTRLAQAQRIQFKFHKGAADHTYMRIDGEPWKQPLPEDGDKVVVEISHLGQVKMLATENCIANCIHDATAPPSGIHHDKEASNDDSDDKSEERKKFGAADTFTYPPGQIKMLATENCIAKCIHDATTPSSGIHHDKEASSEDSDDKSEERKNFGASDAFTYPLPEDGDKAMVGISHLGQVKMLATENCMAKCIHDATAASSGIHHDQAASNQDSDDKSEERKKFGAADTFTYPDNIGSTLVG